MNGASMEDGSETLLVCNWKAYLGRIESEELAGKIARVPKDEINYPAIIVLPSLPFLLDVKNKIGRAKISLGAQNFDIDGIGAHTGSVNIEMIKDIGCEYALIGHSELRYRSVEGLNENDDIIGRKLDACLRAGVRPILCIGEKAEERDRGEKGSVLRREIKSAFGALSEDVRGSMGRIIIAYEPVWAISANKPVSPPDKSEIEETLKVIRENIEEVIGKNGKNIKLLYGGSVDTASIGKYLEVDMLEGFLVGRASTDAEKLNAMADIISRRKPKQI